MASKRFFERFSPMGSKRFFKGFPSILHKRFLLGLMWRSCGGWWDVAKP